MPKIQIEPGPFIVPMPVVLVGANVEGRPNFMTAAFVGIVNVSPPIIVCGLNATHHTSLGIVANRSFSLNVPSEAMVEVTDWCGIASGNKTDKSTAFTVVPGRVTGAPMVSECRLTAECRLVDTRPFTPDVSYFAEIVAVYADEEVMTDGALDWSKVSPLLFTFPDKSYRTLGDKIAKAWSVGKDYTSKATGE